MYRLHGILLLVFGPPHTWGHGGSWWFWGPAFFGFWVLVIATVAVAFWLVARRGGNHYVPAAPSHRAMHNARAILAERFARGEIDADEYQDRLAHLRSTEIDHEREDR